MMEEVSDEQLMVAVAARQQRAFRVLMDRHMRRSISIAQRVVLNAADADEIGQEAFLRVWNHAGSFDPGLARFTTWLYRIVVNLALDRVRRPAHAPIEAASTVSDDAPDPAERLMARERITQLNAAMAQLSDRQRTALALFHIDGLSGEEAARIMRVSNKAFESLLGRARAALRMRVQSVAEKAEGGGNDVDAV
jgi:RNA polymerase sigma-70 factor (ECF subfamily)